jgi:hypothetical protein
MASASGMDEASARHYVHGRGVSMATMISEVYDAFIASGAPEDKARKAAEAIAAYEGRFNKIENDLNILKWMNGVTWALCLGILFRLFMH